MMINFLTSKDLGEVLKTKVKLKIPISGISINSKLVKKGDLFIPIKGKNYDGHKFIKEALNKGAVTSLANPNFFKKLKLNKYKNKIIFVNNPRVSLNDLALFVIFLSPVLPCCPKRIVLILLPTFATTT